MNTERELLRRIVTSWKAGGTDAIADTVALQEAAELLAPEKGTKREDASCPGSSEMGKAARAAEPSPAGGTSPAPERRLSKPEDAEIGTGPVQRAPLWKNLAPDAAASVDATKIRTFSAQASIANVSGNIASMEHIDMSAVQVVDTRHAVGTTHAQMREAVIALSDIAQLATPCATSVQRAIYKKASDTLLKLVELHPIALDAPQTILSQGTIQPEADSLDEALRRLCVEGEACVTLSQECRDKLAVEMHEALAPEFERIRQNHRRALRGLELMTSARDYEKAAHQRTIDYYAKRAEPTPDGVVQVILTIQTRIWHTAAREKLEELLQAVRRIAEELDEYASLRVVGEVPETASEAKS